MGGGYWGCGAGGCGGMGRLAGLIGIELMGVHFGLSWPLFGVIEGGTVYSV